jgi:DNA-directed RNA polymerase specialized sigma24 family protein
VDDKRDMGRDHCVARTGRASNDELRAWLAADATDGRSFQSFFQAVAPLLLAYFEGQQRGRTFDLEVMTLETLVAVYRHRAGYDPAQPVRAWLLGMARQRMTSHLHGERSSRALGDALGLDRGLEQDALRQLRRLARRPAETVRGSAQPERSQAVP